MMDSSFIKAILTSRCVFSIIFAASATLIDDASWTPGSTIILYTSAISLDDSASHPETTFKILVIVCSLSPGFMRSGEYPTLKSVLNFKPETYSKTGIQSSSVQPGYTVLS
jgi:hypothetical protein